MTAARNVIRFVALLFATCGVVAGQSSGDVKAPPEADRPAAEQTFAALKVEGALRSRYRSFEPGRAAGAAPEPDLQSFRRDVFPVLEKACFQCHGPDKQKGDVRIDTLDPDLFGGDDVDWWLDVLGVLANGEMPPEGEAELADDDRRAVIEWLSAESQTASAARRATRKHSSFRRMARYEYSYALQDLLGLPYDFGDDLPPDPTSEDGFQNSSEVLHITGPQFRAYLESARKALRLATVAGEQPEPLYWGISMEAAAAVEWAKQDRQLAGIRKKHADDPEAMEAELARQMERFTKRPRGARYEDRVTGRQARQSWGYNGAKFAWKPTTRRPEPPEGSDQIAVLPPSQGLILELGDQIPERGTLRVRVRASRASTQEGRVPSMQLLFGWQASNDSSAVVAIGGEVVVSAAPEAAQFYQWDVPLSQVYPRNSMRAVTELGDLPSPSEYVKLVNASASGGDIHIDYVEVTAPFYEQWPPASHTLIFADRREGATDLDYAREVLTRFMSRAWRRAPTAAEVERKIELFERLRPDCDSVHDALVEALAAVLASPNFLYLVESAPTAVRGDVEGGLEGNLAAAPQLSELELASRLAMFLWCSTPDDELLALAKRGQLTDPEVLSAQVERMVSDPRSRRFSREFVRQWLGLELLEFLDVDRKLYPQFDSRLKGAMAEEPVAFFHEVLRQNEGVLEFLHSDFAMVNERLAKHYGMKGVTGNHFRRVELGPQQGRGGLLTQAGLLAMNSDGKDSHPLKRGVWMLERVLNDPPPPPPAAVPEIDLADPEIAKMTLKQRIENHRDQPACMSCHVKIDPWGLAFENFDAVGSWRTKVQGRPVDAVSFLFNKQKLDGVDGLKRFLLKERQDQFVRALAYKMTTFALGRPLTFEDRAAIDEIAAATRTRGDGLATLVMSIATSTLFQSK